VAAPRTTALGLLVLLSLALTLWIVWHQLFSPNALLVAATRGRAADVRAVLDRGVPVEARDPLGKGTALIHAAATGSPVRWRSSTCC
jgi:hypothetical protein